VGKRTIALRLKRYLRYFHGAKCKAFDICKLSNGRDLMSPLEPSKSCSLRRCEFFDELRSFLESTDGDLGQRSNGGGRAAATPGCQIAYVDHKIMLPKETYTARDHF
jgi:hypothetical protein